MNILPGILCFLNIIDVVFKIKERLIKPVDKAAASTFLGHIGATLNVVADELEAGRYPHGKCQEMWHYMDELKGVLASTLDEAHLVYLTERIAESYRVEQLAGQLFNTDPAAKVENISVLRSAAGSFTAVANIIRLK